MGIDYYGVLNIKKCASKAEIKQAYRRLALELHPAKERDKQDEDVTFATIGEAYDVLSDNINRAVYDQYGEEGLKAGVPAPRQFIQPYVYHGDPIRTFQEFFGKENPFADLLDVLIHPLPLFVLGNHIGVKNKSPDVYHALPLSLNEVYYGGFKQVLIERQEICIAAQGEPAVIRSTKILKTLQFKPGIPPGTEFRFPEAGNQGPDIIPADVIFVTEDKVHETFKREGDQKTEHQNHMEMDNFIDERSMDSCKFRLPNPMPHLSILIQVSLSQALTGFTTKVNTIDGRILKIAIAEIVSPSYEKVIPGEGLPIFGDKDGQKGELRMRFDIQFPLYPFPTKSRLSLKQTLPKTKDVIGKIEVKDA